MEVSELEARQELAAKALDFLKAIAMKAKDELGPHPERKQRASWMVSTGPGHWVSQDFERNIFDSASISQRYQMKWMPDGFPEKRRLEEALSANGIPTPEQPYLFCFALLHHWLQLPDPFAFDDSAITNLLDEFVDAVLRDVVITKSRFAINGLNSAKLPISLEKDITIRQVTKEELWDYGDINFIGRPMPYKTYYIPSESWKILMITFSHYRKGTPSRPYTILDAVLALLRLASPGLLQIIDLGTEVNYGSLGRAFEGRIREREIGRYEGVYTLNEKMSQYLQESWPEIRKIMESDTHYLRLPAQRLLDGGLRNRPEDAILDYAIGLERLLTAGVEDELSYRFALRGATILGWEKGHKKALYDNLKKFYDLRSFIVHGSKRKKAPKLSPDDACLIGEDYLRRIWWWFLRNGFTEAKMGLIEGTEKIDNHILSNLTLEDSCRGSRHEQEIEN